jgi:hypothetical protein
VGQRTLDTTSFRSSSARIRIVARDLSRRLLTEPAIEDTSQSPSNQRGYPEQPKLGKCPSADEQRGPVLRAGFTEVFVIRRVQSASKSSRAPSGSSIATVRAVAIGRMSVSGCRSLRQRPPLAAVASGSNVFRAAHAAGSCMERAASAADAAIACVMRHSTSLPSRERRHGRSKSASASGIRAGSMIPFQRDRRTCAGRPMSGLKTNTIGSTTPGRSVSWLALACEPDIRDHGLYSVAAEPLCGGLPPAMWRVISCCTASGWLATARVSARRWCRASCSWSISDRMTGRLA